MDIGDVLSEAWNLYKRFLWQFFLTALVVFAVLDLLSALAGEAAGDSVGAGIFWGLIAFTIGTLAFWFDLPWLVWASAGLLVVGVLIGLLLSKLGYGVKGPRYVAKDHS